MKIIAKQVPPEYQESPLFLGGDCWPENVFVFGNKYFNQHADTLNDLRTALENIVDVFDDMQRGGGWTDDLQYAIHCELPKEYHREYSRPERLKMVELANKYCFANSFEENTVLCEVLELITKKLWCYNTIKGCSQSDWQNIIFPAEYGREWLERFEAEYFNTGTEWLVDPDGENFSIYCYSWNNDGIRKEIAEAAGTTSENVILYAFKDWKRIPEYVEVTE